MPTAASGREPDTTPPDGGAAGDAEAAEGMPLPAAWPRVWGERDRRRPRAMLGVGVALLVIAVAMAVSSNGRQGPLWSGVVFGLFGLTALAVFVRAPFGRGTFQLVNAVALTDARVRPPDSWVHLVRERRVGMPLLIILAAWAAVFAAAAVAAVVIGISGRPQAFLGLVVLAVIAVVLVYAAVRGMIAQYRLGSFGRRPVGLSLGPSGIAVLRVSDPLYIPWDAIRSVEADATAPRRGQEQVPVVLLRVDPPRVRTADGGRVGATVTLSPTALRVHPHVVWAALRTFTDDHEQRARLGTTFGQQLLDQWCAAARG